MAVSRSWWADGTAQMASGSSGGSRPREGCEEGSAAPPSPRAMTSAPRPVRPPSALQDLPVSPRAASRRSRGHQGPGQEGDPTGQETPGRREAAGRGLRPSGVHGSPGDWGPQLGGPSRSGQGWLRDLCGPRNFQGSGLRVLWLQAQWPTWATRGAQVPGWGAWGQVPLGLLPHPDVWRMLTSEGGRAACVQRRGPGGGGLSKPSERP